MLHHDTIGAKCPFVAADHHCHATDKLCGVCIFTPSWRVASTATRIQSFPWPALPSPTTMLCSLTLTGFLVLKKHSSAIDFSRVKQSIEYKLGCCCDNGLTDDESNGVLKRFTCSEGSPNKHIKSLVRVAGEG